MASAEVGEQEHEAGIDTVIKDTLGRFNDRDYDDDIQVTAPVATDEDSSVSQMKTAMATDRPEEPRQIEALHSTSKLRPSPVDHGTEGQLHAELAISTESEELVEATRSETEPNPVKVETKQILAEKEPQFAVEAGKPEASEFEKRVSTNATSETKIALKDAKSIDQIEVATKLGDKEQSAVLEQNEDSSLLNAEDEERDGADLTPEQSSESFPAKSSSFLESLTANFAADTKVMWAQIFGPRYDDGDEEDFQENNLSKAGSNRESVSSKSSLQTKLARERKLDEQIQASQRRYRERILRNEAANNAATRRARVRSSRRSQTQITTVSPFEQAGLSLTQVRFCTEKALDETCKCFRHLHAAALEESEDPDQPLTQGIYITQGELDHILRELFDPQELKHSNSRTRKGTFVAPLDFSQNGGVSMNIQLQASWFIPFGQLQQLRSLVMKITKRHLNEEKLAIVNRQLQKQLTLLPLSAKLQILVLQLANYQLNDPPQAPIWPGGNKSSDELAQDLLGCIAVNEFAGMTEREDYNNSVLFLPVELVAKMEPSSVVCAQRLVFFRYLIDIVAAERMRLRSKTTEPSEPPIQPPVRLKSVTGRRRSPSKKKAVEPAPASETTIQNCEQPVDNDETASIRSVNDSLPNASEADGVSHAAAGEEIFEPPEPVGDECEKRASQLQQQLESAIAQLRQALPTIDLDVALNPAIRATYLAAVTCHESVLLMLENNIDVDAAMSNKLKHFIEALQGVQSQSNEQPDTPATSPSMEVEHLDHQLSDPPRFPPPYPESTVSEEDSKNESSTLQTQFPPPYAITSPSYWTFTPSIPEPKSSIAKLATTSPCNKSADFRSHFMSKESPGEGAYNIQKGEQLTFQRKPSYSFGPTEGDRSRKAPNAKLGKGSIGKRSRQWMKTSLEFIPPPVHSPKENNDFDAGTSTRVNAGFQFINDHGTGSNENLFTDLPPDYNQGDANEVPEERAGEGDETEMDRALRLQQRIFMDEFVQQMVSNQESPTHFVPRNKPHTEKADHSKSKPYWATSEVSPGIERLLHRQRRAPSASKSRPSSASTAPVQPRTTRRVAKKPQAPPPPPRRQLDNDQHLAWAARISELYQPDVSTPNQ